MSLTEFLLSIAASLIAGLILMQWFQARRSRRIEQKMSLSKNSIQTIVLPQLEMECSAV
jgi:hypothetical protein